MFSFKIIMNREELEKKFKVFEKEIIQINEQVSVVEQATIDLEKISLGLDEIAGKKDSEILAPMGRGIFVKTKLISEELTVDIGGGNFVTKTVPETKEMLDEQIKKLNSMKKELEKELEKIEEEITKVMGEHEENKFKHNNPH